MATKLQPAGSNRTTSGAALTMGYSGAAYVNLPNGKKVWCLTTAITANVTLDDAVAVGPAAGDYAVTSHATGLGSIFVSDGTKWQFLTNA
jgi:hypothetical protein